MLTIVDTYSINNESIFNEMILFHQSPLLYFQELDPSRPFTQEFILKDGAERTENHDSR